MKPSFSTLPPVKPSRRGVCSAILALSLSVVWPAWAVTPFTVNSNGTVTDGTTSLVWDQCTYGLSGNTCDAGAAMLGTWPQALMAAVAANAANYKGFSDWRVPNKNELESIVKRDTYLPAIDTTIFPNTPITGNPVLYDSTWTSTTDAALPSGSWVVDFFVGYTFVKSKNDANYVRLVRSGQHLASFDLLDTTPPVTTAGLAISSGPSSTTAGISVTIDESGTGYWLLVPSAALAPTPLQVLAGVNYAAVTVVNSGNTDMTAATPASISLSGMVPSTAYKLYFVAKDRANNLQVSPSNVAVTTTAPVLAPPTCTLSALPATVDLRGSSTLTPSCSPPATSYAWLGGICAGTSGSTCTVTPAATTIYSVIGTNANGSGAAASATVTVTSPVVLMVPGTLTFSEQYVSTTSLAQTITLSNTGNAPLRITNIAGTVNVFALNHNCGATLAASANCTVDVTFSPTAVGTRVGAITLSSDAAGSPHSVITSGTGVTTGTPICSLTANPVKIQRNQSATLTANCSPAAASYTWTGNSCVGTVASTCTVRPTVTTSYSVTGTNGAGGGNVSSATVTVYMVDLAPILMLLLD